MSLAWTLVPIARHTRGLARQRAAWRRQQPRRWGAFTGFIAGFNGDGGTPRYRNLENHGQATFTLRGVNVVGLPVAYPGAPMRGVQVWMIERF